MMNLANGGLSDIQEALAWACRGGRGIGRAARMRAGGGGAPRSDPSRRTATRDHVTQAQ